MRTDTPYERNSQVPETPVTRVGIAGQFEDSAARIVANVPDADRPAHAIALAQVSATLALCQRVADLTDKTKTGLGYIEDRLSEINAAVRG